MEITTERVEIPLAEGGTMAGYLARPTSGGPHPAVIVFMEIFGVNSHIRDVTERVAREGYVAIAPDYFHRTGAGMELEYTEEGMATGMGHLGQLVADQMIGDARSTVAFVKARSDTTDKVGAIGFCIGGHMTYLSACEADIDAAASYYGGGIAAPKGPGGAESTLSRTSKITGRIHCYFGGKDALIPTDQVAAVRSALESAGTAHEIVLYDEADHGFHCDQRATFHESSAADAWERTKALFRKELAA